MDSTQTVCIICGRTRIFSRRWKEKIDGRGSIVTHTESVCPDKECQKKVDFKFWEMREKKRIGEDRRKASLLLKRGRRKGGGEIKMTDDDKKTEVTEEKTTEEVKKDQPTV